MDMGFVVTSILFFVGIILYSKKKTISSPDILFCLEWGAISFLASLQLYTLYEASLKTWMIILIGSLFFVVGTAFGNRIMIKRAKYDTEGTVYHDNPLMNRRWFWIFVIFMVGYTLYDFLQSYRYLMMGYSLGEIREASVGIIKIPRFVRRTGGVAEYFGIIFSGIELFTVATGITYFISDMRKNFKMMVGVLAYVILRSFTNGGRFGLAYIVVEVFVCYSLYRSSEGYSGIILSQKAKKWMRGIILFVIAVILMVTLIRGAAINELIVKFYRYICGNVVFFDLHVQDLDQSQFWSLSFASLYGLWIIFLPILNKLGISYPQLYLDSVSKVMDTQTYREIGDELVTNAFITPFYHLYADFRWIGVIVGMFLFGAVAGYLYKKAKYYMDGTQIVYYLIISQMIFKTLQTYPLTMKEYIFALAAMIFLGGRHRRRIVTGTQLKEYYENCGNKYG